MAFPHAASAPEPTMASAAPDTGQVLRRELMRPQTHTSDDVNKQAMAMGGQLMMRAAAGQQVCPVMYLARKPGHGLPHRTKSLRKLQGLSTSRVTVY